MLAVNTFFHIAKYEPKILKKLENIVSPINGENLDMKNVELIGYINNVMIKMGFMLIAYDYLKKKSTKHRKHEYVYSTYHLFNFIFATKAFLDAVAMVLNYHYNLDYKGGNIDLKNNKFVNSIKNKNSDLGKQILNDSEWINDVVQWRNALIHRISPTILPQNENNDTNNNIVYGMPLYPFTIFDYSKIDKIGKDYQEIPQFCKKWIDHAKIIFEYFCSVLVDELKDIDVVPKVDKNGKVIRN